MTDEVGYLSHICKRGTSLISWQARDKGSKTLSPSWRLEGPNYHAAVLASAVLLLALACGMKDVDGRLSIGGFRLRTVCPLKNLTGLDCPSCGVTRSVVSCCRGRFAEAAGFSPVGVALFAILLAQVPLRAVLLGARPLRGLDTRRVDLWTGVTLLLFAAGRMVFEFLPSARKL